MRAKIFGIGLSRTGTTTFNEVMSELGLLSRSEPSELGLALFELDRFDDICDIIDKYDCLCDMPYPLLYEKLFARHPDSLFVLTTSSSEDEWLESLRAMNLRNGPAEAFRIAYGCSEVANNENHLLSFYRTHNDAARRFFKDSNRFVEICWEQGNGLRRLASLLRVDAAGIRVPVANASTEKIPRKIVKRYCDRGRYGSAARFVRSIGNPPELLALINKSLDREINEFSTWSKPKAALQRFTSRARIDDR